MRPRNPFLGGAGVTPHPGFNTALAHQNRLYDGVAPVSAATLPSLKAQAPKIPLPKPPGDSTVTAPRLK